MTLDKATTDFIAILVCDKTSESLKQYGSFGDLTIASFKKLGLTEYRFKQFDVFLDEFPTLEELQFCKGVHITGSSYNPYSKDYPWITHLIDFIRKCLQLDFPIVGSCFGHQICGIALGLKAERNPNGWELGLTEIKVNPQPELKKFATDKDTLTYNIMQVHRNQIIIENSNTLPEGYYNVGSSEKCKLQGLYKPGKLLTFQGHVEFYTEYGNKLVENIVRRHAIDTDVYSRALERSKKLKNDGEYLGAFMVELLKNCNK